MTYIIQPNSITTGSLIEAGKLNENFSVFQQGIVGGTYQADPASIAASFVGAADMEISGDRTLTKAGGGQRAMITLHTISNTDGLGTSNGYMLVSGGEGSLTNKAQVMMVRSGSVLGATLSIDCLSHNSTVVNNYNVVKTTGDPWSPDLSYIPLGQYSVNTAAKFGTNAVYARNTYQFAPGDSLSLHKARISSGLVMCDMSITIEVVFDE